jgi:hypothetical protein
MLSIKNLFSALLVVALAAIASVNGDSAAFRSTNVIGIDDFDRFLAGHGNHSEYNETEIDDMMVDEEPEMKEMEDEDSHDHDHESHDEEKEMEGEMSMSGAAHLVGSAALAGALAVAAAL